MKALIKMIILWAVSAAVVYASDKRAPGEDCGERDISAARLDPVIIDAAARRLPGFEISKASAVSTPAHFELEGISDRVPVEIKLSLTGEVLCVEYEQDD